jgi:hypothetical protein
LLSVVLGLYGLTVPHTPPQRGGDSWLAPLAALHLFRDRSFAIFWLCLVGVCMTMPITQQLNPLLLDRLGVPHCWLTPTLTLGQTTEVATLALLPVLLPRLGMRRIMLLGLAAWALLLSLLMRGAPLGLVVPALSLNGLCVCCFIVAGQVFVNSQAGDQVRTCAQALITFTYGTGMLAGNLLVGWVRQRSMGELQPVFAVGAFIAASLVALFFAGFRQMRPSIAAGDDSRTAGRRNIEALVPAPAGADDYRTL